MFLFSRCYSTHKRKVDLKRLAHYGIAYLISKTAVSLKYLCLLVLLYNTPSFVDSSPVKLKF